MVAFFFGFARNLRSNNFFVEGNVKRLQTARTKRVEGMVTTQYTHIRFEAFKPSSPKVKKVVLKNACDCMSQMKEKRSQVVCTEIKVAGRNVIVKSVIDFTTLLSS